MYCVNKFKKKKSCKKVSIFQKTTLLGLVCCIFVVKQVKATHCGNGKSWAEFINETIPKKKNVKLKVLNDLFSCGVGRVCPKLFT